MIFGSMSVEAANGTFCLRELQNSLKKAAAEANGDSYQPDSQESESISIGEELMMQTIQMNHESLVLQIRF